MQRRAISPGRCLLACCLLSLLPPQALTAVGSRYFPARGPGAVHQRILDARFPVTVLSLAAEPGMEDLATLAALRLGSGARIVSAYMTDGESTPSDLDGALPFQAGARRRIEADRAVRMIGGEALFLGFPDYGLVGTRGRLSEFWIRDSVLARLVRLVESVRPDVILLARDGRALAGDTVRASLLRALLVEAAGVSRRVMPHPGAGGEHWSVLRILQEDTSRALGVSVDTRAVHPVWRKRFSEIAGESASSYASLRLRIHVWNRDRKFLYRLLWPSGEKPPAGLLDGLPLITPELRDPARDVAVACTQAEKGTGVLGLRAVAAAISTVERTIVTHRKELQVREQRTLLGWKWALEDLRCAIRDIDVRFIASDTLLARRQLFTIRFPSRRDFPSGGRSEIVFPSAADSTWWINKRTAYLFPFTLPDTLELITPDNLPLNRPVAVNSRRCITLNNTLPFIIAHRDPDPVMNFAFRGEFIYGTGLPQTFEILTPILRVAPGARLLVRLQNISRDPYTGTISVGDSVARESHIKVSLPRKDYTVTETLPLSWNEEAADGDYTVELHIGRGKAVGTFTARKFRAEADTADTVGLVTGIGSSPVEEALRGLRVPCRLLGAATFPRTPAPGLRVVVIDRDALSLRRDAAALSAALAAWVRDGGHCVMLVHRYSWPDSDGLGRQIRFEGGHPLPPETRVAAEPASTLLLRPNRITDEDWNGWIIARALSILKIEGEPAVHVKNASTGASLVASVRMGKGILTAVALDILPQLQMIHPGAYRLLANLVSY